MAIDDIEYNELGSLSKSRLGSKTFINDDDRYAYANRAKRNREMRMKEIQGKYAIPKERESDCFYLQDRLEEASNELEAFRKTFKGRVEQAYIDGLEFVIANYKTMISKAKCVETKEKQEKEQEQKQTVETLAAVAATPPPLIADDSKDNTKYIIYGVGGLILVIGIVLLIKRSN